uniref:Coq4 family protein n=1 Tax=Acaryochloris sp. IP29b_bin.137 TaxID=2969217 RepID=UPI002612665C
MGFKYINEIATPDNINQLLTFIDHVAGAGTDVNEVFDISDLLRDSPQMERCLTWMREDPATAQMIEEQYLGPEYDLDKMLQMPEGSLGWTYARVMSALGYEPHFYRLRNMETDADYVINRIRKTHDLHHILT